VGHSRATDLLLSSRMVDAEEALRIGLLDHLVPTGSVVDAAVAYAADLARRCSPASMATIKSQLRNDADGTYADSVTRAEGVMLQAFRGADFVEGVASHLDKRTPSFPSLPVRS
jgi:enoyl-CoA hydratase/carnithine racemase